MATSCPRPVTQPRFSPSFAAGHWPTWGGVWPTFWKHLRVFLLASVVLTVVLSPGTLGSPKRLGISFAFTFAYTTGLWLVNAFALDWLNDRVSWTAQPLRRLLITLGLSLGGSLVVILLIQVGLLLVLRKPLALLWQPAMYGQVLLPLGVTLIVSLFNHSRAFFMQWREAAVRAERLEKETAVARLDSLRRQVDPHFLFNSLNALTSLVEEHDPARAVRFIRQLSQVYRYVLDSQAHELVPLAEELRFAEAYLFLQKTRLGDALVVELALPPPADLAAYRVPPLALQLLLENALKHNTAFQTDPLRLRITLDAPARTLTVRHLLRPRRLAPGEASGVGLHNLAARYAFLTDTPLAIGPTGNEFVATIPLLVIND